VISKFTERFNYKKAKFAKRVKCGYCGEMRPKYMPAMSIAGGIRKIAHRLPNGLWKCAICRTRLQVDSESQQTSPAFPTDHD